MQWVMNIANKALDNTQGGVIAGFGIVLLLWSVIRMLSSTELAMNRIWGVKKGRSLVKKFTDYMSILFIAPILVVLISSMNVFMMANLQEYAMDEGLLSYASAALKAILTLIPYILVWFLFVFLYMFMPTTPVKFKYALVAGIVAGTVFQIVQWFYLRFQIGVSSYNAIYGGLAALPLLLVWLQLSWSIVLWGTELCYIMRNRHFLYRNAMNADNKWVDNVEVTLRMLRYISDLYIHGQGSPTLAMVCKRLRMSSSKVRVILQELVDHKILVEVKEDDDVSYFPAVDFHRLSVADIINRLSRLSTPAGLSEWFADDVFQKGNQFIFIWNGSEQPATLVELKSNAVVRFRWDDAEEEDEYFEFNIHVEPLTGDVALIITDFADEDEVNDTIELWNKQMDILHRNLGA